MRPLVYLAGPITTPNPMHNTAESFRVAREIHDSIPVVLFVPHVSVLWDIADPRDYEWWMEYDFDVIANCEALFRMPGVSPGADREVAHAQSIGVPTFIDCTDLALWVTRWQAKAMVP